MSWKKMNHIFQPTGKIEWMKSHAQVPTVHVMSNCFRVFFSTRNEAGKSQIACIDLDRKNPSNIIQLHEKPVLSFGNPGTFDDDGVMPSYVISQEGKLFLYYSGWNQRVHVPYHNAMGVAVSTDHGLTFERLFEGPIMDRTPHEPFIAVTPSVLKEDDGWKMWYVSGIRWELIENKFEPIYVIKYAYSQDGIFWQRPNITCINQRYQHEAFSRPTVLKKNNTYHMWYCYRNSFNYRDGEGSYQIGYAHSEDGIQWHRQDDKVGITFSTQGWDSTMICYPFVINVDDELIMFYNGNGFGQSGFGYAILK